jgi:uncharacterized protein (TIGR02453 family)
MPFTDETFTFLSELAAHNERDWFQANKKRYEAHVKDAALGFIAEFSSQLRAISPHFLAIPKVQGGSLMRIYRDTRFSKDKTPYKTNIGMHFNHTGSSKSVHAPGFYLHLEPGDSGAAVGIWQPDSTALGKIRDAIVADPDGWQAVRDAADAADGYSWWGQSLKRPPRGYDKDHPFVEDLKRKDLILMAPIADRSVTDDDFAAQVARRYEEATPLVVFLCKALGLPY